MLCSCWRVLLALSSINPTIKGLLEVKSCNGQIQPWPYRQPLNFTIARPQWPPCAWWFNLHGPSAMAAAIEPNLGEERERPRALWSSWMSVCLTLHPVGQLYVNVHKGLGEFRGRQQLLGLLGMTQNKDPLLSGQPKAWTWQITHSGNK